MVGGSSGSETSVYHHKIYVYYQKLIVEDEVQVCQPNSGNLQTQPKYSIEDDDDVKFSLAKIRKMQNTAESETSAIDKTVSSTKATIGKG